MIVLKTIPWGACSWYCSQATTWYYLAAFSTAAQGKWGVAWERSLVPRLHLRERVWWHPADSSGFINVDYLERNFSPSITLQKTESVLQHRKFLATSVRWHSTFFGAKLVIGSQLCPRNQLDATRPEVWEQGLLVAKSGSWAIISSLMSLWGLGSWVILCM